MASAITSTITSVTTMLAVVSVTIVTMIMMTHSVICSWTVMSVLLDAIPTLYTTSLVSFVSTPPPAPVFLLLLSFRLVLLLVLCDGFFFLFTTCFLVFLFLLCVSLSPRTREIRGGK